MLHAEDVARLWTDYRSRENRRVPVAFACDEQMWLRVAGRNYREFYHDPEVQVAVQLEGKRWFCEHIHGDMAPGLPERWTLAPQFWMTENELCGCSITYQENGHAWGQPLPLPRGELLAHIRGIDPAQAVRCSHTYRLYQGMKACAAGMTFAGRPVDVLAPIGTHGVFTKAAEIRGIERLCLDLYEDPEFAVAYLHVLTEKILGFIQAWREVETGHPPLPAPAAWGFADDSIQLLSADHYRQFVVPCHARLYAAMTRGARSIHVCGHATQHYATFTRELGISKINGPGPFADHGRYLHDLGPDLAFDAQTDHTVLITGPVEDIRRMMRDMLTPAAKVPGRFNIMGFITPDVPLEHVRACYDAGKEFGTMAV